MQQPQPSIVVIGNFDGVHRGHRALVQSAAQIEPGLRLLALTFWPHPQAVVAPGTEPVLLQRLPDRIEHLRAAGVDEVRVVPFTRELMTWEPAEFVERVLLPLEPRVVCVGENFTFGRRAGGTVETLRDLGQGRFRVEVVELVEVEREATCSSLVREALAAGDVRAAAEHLGRQFSYAGVVVMGHQRGRELGFPTANLPVEPGHAAPGEGVYAGWLEVEGGEPMPAAISVGRNPTFDDVTETVIEAYVLDRDDLSLYGRTVRVEFVERLRGNVRFDGLDALVEQMHADVERTREVLGIGARPLRPTRADQPIVRERR